MGAAIAIAAAGLATSIGGLISGGLSASAQQEQANREAQRRWTQETIEKGLFNAREMFMASYNTLKQRKQNQALFEAALKYDIENSEILRKKSSFVQKQIAQKTITDVGAIKNSMAMNGVSLSSGTAKAISFATLMSSIKDSETALYNSAVEKMNLQTQKENMLAQQQFNIFIPNTSLNSQGPSLGNPNIPLYGALATGAVAAGVGFAGFANFSSSGTTPTIAMAANVPTTSSIATV
jgi:hypothetical protein